MVRNFGFQMKDYEFAVVILINSEIQGKHFDYHGTGFWTSIDLRNDSNDVGLDGQCWWRSNVNFGERNRISPHSKLFTSYEIFDDVGGRKLRNRQSSRVILCFRDVICWSCVTRS